MKKIFLLILCCAGLLQARAQAKPWKTFNHEKFANKVYGNFSAGMDPLIFLPEDDALLYISNKTGRSLEELKQEREHNKIYLQQDRMALAKENVGGLMVVSVELKKKEHPSLTMADIVLEVRHKDGNKKIELGNCIQTDLTWVLGDYIGMEGKKPVREKILSKEEIIQQLLSDSSKNYRLIAREWDVQELVVVNPESPKGILYAGAQITRNNQKWFAVTLREDGTAQGYMYEGLKDYKSIGDHYILDTTKATVRFMEGPNQASLLSVYHLGQKKMILTADLKEGKHYFIAYPVIKRDTTLQVETAPDPAIPRKKWTATYTTTATDPALAFIKPELFDKPVRGYYIKKDGTKVDAVIKYQDPSKMHANSSTLLLYNIAYNESGFTEDETNNFKSILMKTEVKAFYVGGYLYVHDGSTNNFCWAILLSEGEIREEVLVATITKEDKFFGYVVNQFLCHRNGDALDLKTMGILFKKQMSDFIKDDAELAQKVADKQEGYKFLQYQKIIKEYNDWFDQQNPGKLEYFYLYE